MPMRDLANLSSRQSRIENRTLSLGYKATARVLVTATHHLGLFSLPQDIALPVWTVAMQLQVFQPIIYSYPRTLYTNR